MRLALAAALLLTATAARAATAATGAVLLRHAQSARAAGLGGGLCADDSGVEALGVNPAGAAGATRPELLSTFTSGVADDAYGFFGYAHPLKGGVATAGLTYYDAGTVELVSPSGAAQSVSAERDYAGSVGWAMPLFGGLTAGATGKFYKSTLAQSASASGFAADLGAQWATPLSGLRLGAALLNAGPGVKYETATDPLPLTGRAGAAWTAALARSSSNDLTSAAVTLGADAVKTRDESTAGVAAAEFVLSFGPATAVSLRGAYAFGASADGLNFGAGVREGRFTADYAIVSKRDLGNVQNVSLRVRF